MPVSAKEIVLKYWKESCERGKCIEVSILILSFIRHSMKLEIVVGLHLSAQLFCCFPFVCNLSLQLSYGKIFEYDHGGAGLSL